MLTPPQVRDYFPDLDDPLHRRARSRLFHSRFSTNTFPSWELAHPYHLIAHNGEINTLRGNINWMRAREAMLASSLFGDDLEKVLPIVREGLSDSACLDSVLELLVQTGRSLPHAVMMLVPEAWEHHDTMSEEKKAFYAYHSCLVEPWDGPACVTFTDGVQIGAVLDRNGLRPARYWVTADDYVILASEVGVLDVPTNQVIEKGRLQPGKMFLVDLAEGRIIADEEIKHRIATEKPYQEWVSQHLVPLEALQPAETPAPHTGESLRTLQHAFGYTQEDLKVLMAPMALKGEEPIGSMGNDAAHRRAQPPRAAAARLLPAAVRAGHQPAARRDPREARDLGRDRDRPRAQPARSAARELPDDPLREPVPRQLADGALQGAAALRPRRPPAADVA